MNKKLKAYKFRLYPNNTQEVLLNKTFGCVRFFYNQQVETFNSYNRETNPKPEFKTSTTIRNEFEWMKEVSAAAIQQKEIDFKQFKKQLFNTNRKVKIGRPKFKSKSNRQSFRLPNQKFKILDSKVQLEKIGKIRFSKDRELPLDCKLISITISKNPSGQYFISILVEQTVNNKFKTNKDVGIDLGVKMFATQSDGLEVNNPRYFNENQVKLKRLQQHFSRKKKGSSRRFKCKIAIAKLYQKITNQRDYFLHEYSSFLINNYDTIYIEDLDIKSMLESKLMSKNISDVSWSKFVTMLEYKSDWYGKKVIKVDRYFASSKTCSCGIKNENLRLSDREWVCGACGSINQRDLLAAENILKEGRKSSGDITDVESEVTSSVKR